MAKFEMDDLEALQLSFDQIAKLPDEVIEEMLNAEADIIVEAQKESARKYGVRDTGLEIESIGKTKVQQAKDGKCIHVYPQGSRTRNGITTRNAEIGFLAEFGKTGVPARPFIRDANEKAADQAVDDAYKIYDNYLKSKKL